MDLHVKAAIFTVFIASLLFLIPQTVFAYSVTGNAVKTDEAVIGAGVTPDSFLYFLDKALDNINLALTFDSAEKANKGLNVARERLMETREMAVANKFEAAQRAQQEHTKALGIVQSSIGKLHGINSTHELEEEIELETDLEEHEKEVEEVQAELKIKLEVKGEITPEQQTLIDSVLDLMQNKTGEVKIRIENKKGETKIKIKVETGKSEIEIEKEIGELEEKVGLSELKREKAKEQIKDALEEIADVNEKLLEVNLTQFNATAITELISQAEQKMARAQEAFNETKFGEAFGLANAAEQLTKNAEKLLERILEGEEEKEKGVKAEEREIEVEIEEGIAKVKVKIAGNKLKYNAPFTTEDDLLSDIALRTGLSLEEVKALAKIKVEEYEIEEEVKKEIKKDNASEEMRRIVIKDRTKENESKEDVKEVEEKDQTKKEQKEAEEGKSVSGKKSDSNSEGKSGSGSGNGGSGSGSDKGSNSDSDD